MWPCHGVMVVVWSYRGTVVVVWSCHGVVWWLCNNVVVMSPYRIVVVVV